MNDPNPVPAPAPAAAVPPRTVAKSLLATIGPWVASALACLWFILIIASIFVGWEKDWDKTLLHQLSDTGTARGLITFLIAVATVGIALTLTIFIVATDDPDPKNKFALGKEVLTALIGVLGTIVGFYFGASTDANRHATPLSISAFKASPTSVKKGDVAVMDAAISGGEPPYNYTILLSQDGAKVQYIGAEGTTQGSVQSKISIPESVDPAKKIDVVFEASDKAKTISRNHLDLDLVP